MALLSRREMIAEPEEKTIEINAQMQGTLSFKVSYPHIDRHQKM